MALKKIFSCLIILSSALVYGQNELKIEVDKFTGDTTYSSGFMPIDGGYKEMVMLEMQRGKNKLIVLTLSVSTNNVTCFTEGSKAIFLFDNGQKDTLYGTQSLNCKGYMKFIFDGQLNQIRNLAISPISDIRFFSTDGYFDMELDKGESKFISRKKFPLIVSKFLLL